MTVFGYVQLFAVLLLFPALLLKKRRRLFFLISVFTMIFSLLVHSLVTSDQRERFRIFSLPETEVRSYFFLKLIDEKDIVEIGTRIFAPLMGTAPYDDIFQNQYADLKSSIGWPLATPILSALFPGDAETKNWTVEFLPENEMNPKPAIYLHGAMGSYVIQCWLMASILTRHGYSVVCPALSFNGRWFDPLGETVLIRTIEYVKSKYSNKKILFAGLSNGANGLTQHRSYLAANASAFIQVSGGFPIKYDDHVPTLLLWGQADTTIPIDQALEIQELNPAAILVTVDNDHSAFVRHHDYFREQMAMWLQKIK